MRATGGLKRMPPNAFFPSQTYDPLYDLCMETNCNDPVVNMNLLVSLLTSFPLWYQ